ncbi:TonB-dependent receptor [Sphingomonas colocasiae]|uniref:TonB-dependent receptor n=2 Tax=Sphingomonas colocasiae TaxID=1848973 RepID=A0ABS7PYA9_9SPHN|nr:TonB-dependent receptor [Sphingomonas colocasiae]
MIAAGPVRAQAAGGAMGAAEAADSNEIIVTARKQSENIRDIPDTIQAFSAASLEQAGVESVSDLTQMVSGFRIVEAQQPGVVVINIRGIGQVRNGESPVAVVVDGVQQNSPNQITQDLFDIERIEVLKGPQGALYGRNAIGGAINIVTRAPSDSFSGSAELGYAEGDEFRAKASVSAPLGEKAGFRLAGSYLNRDGQITNATLNEKVDFDESWAVRGALLLEPVEAVKIDLRGSYYDQEAGASWYRSGPANSPREPVVGNLLGKAKRKLGDLSAKLDVDLGSVALTSVTAWSSVKSDLFEELDWEPLDLVAATQTLNVKAWSEELRLSSNTGGSALRWMAGLYYLHTERTLDTAIYLGTDLTGLPAHILGSRLIAQDDNDAYAAFGQVNYKLTDALELTAALRYDIDRRRQQDLSPPVAAVPPGFKATYKSLQPKFSLAYSFPGGTLAYATMAKGFRSGGFNSNDVVTREFKKEELWNYELGFKTMLADRAIYLNGAIFYTDITDRQVFGLDLSTAPAQFIANPIPKSSVWGAELELTARPAKGLELSMGGSLLDTKINSYDTSVFAGTAANGDFKGNKLNQVPRYTLNAAAQYTAEIGSGKLISRIDVSGWGGDYYWEIDNADKQDPVWLVNARLTWAIGDVELTAFARNLFDRRYDLEFVPVNFAGTITGQDLGAAAPPRQIGASVKVKF